MAEAQVHKSYSPSSSSAEVIEPTIEPTIKPVSRIITDPAIERLIQPPVETIVDSSPHTSQEIEPWCIYSDNPNIDINGHIPVTKRAIIQKGNQLITLQPLPSGISSTGHTWTLPPGMTLRTSEIPALRRTSSQSSIGNYQYNLRFSSSNILPQTSASSSFLSSVVPGAQDIASQLQTPKLSPSSSFSSRSNDTNPTMGSKLCHRISEMFFELSRKLEGRKLSPTLNSKFARASCTIETQQIDNNGRIIRGSYPGAFIELDQCTEGGNIISRSFLEEELKMGHLMEPLTTLEHKYPMVCGNGEILHCRGSIKLTITIRPLNGHISLNFSTKTYKDISFYVTESFNTPYQLLLGGDFLQSSRILSRRTNCNHIAAPKGKEVELGRAKHKEVEDQQKILDAQMEEFERKQKEKRRQKKKDNKTRRN